MMTTISRVLTLCGVALASACARPPIPYQEPVPVRPVRGSVAVSQTLSLLDASGSQEAAFADGKAALESLVAAMPEGSYEAGVLVFGGFDRETTGMVPFDRTKLAGAAREASFLEGSTPIYAVLENELSSALRRDSGKAAVVLISDGLATDYAGRSGVDERTLAAARTLVQDRAGETCFHTVGLGDDAAGQAFLRALAETSACGSHRSVASLRDAAAFQALAREVYLGGAAPRPEPRSIPAPVDTDGDGVFDSVDACPGTLRNAPVDERGCWTLQDLRFAVNGDTIEGDFTDSLQEAIRVLSANPDVRVRIDGHTDSDGPAAYNQDLSERRARAVRDYLVEQGGLDASRFEVKGFGESRPAVPNDSPAQKRRNRRVELTLLQ